jgi:general secretion pathway protein J
MRTAGPRHRQGFTLLELMVALALLGMVVAAVYSSWSAIVRGSRVGLTAAAAAQRSRIAVQTLEEALTSARCFAADVQYYAFIGENGNDASLSFVSRLAKSFPRGGRFGDFDVRRVTFSLEPGPESGRQLVMRQNPILMNPDIDEEEHPVVLAKNVKEFQLEFWDGHSRDWLDEWTQSNKLPLMVRITLRLTDDNSTRVVKEAIREIALPAVTVPADWQAPGRK